MNLQDLENEELEKIEDIKNINNIILSTTNIVEGNCLYKHRSTLEKFEKGDRYNIKIEFLYIVQKC